MRRTPFETAFILWIEHEVFPSHQPRIPEQPARATQLAFDAELGRRDGFLEQRELQVPVQLAPHVVAYDRHQAVEAGPARQHSTKLVVTQRPEHDTKFVLAAP